MRMIKMENKSIAPVFEFLQDATFKRKASRGRTQFLKRLEEKSKEYNEALIEIKKEFFLVDKEGELVSVNDKLVYKDKDREKELEKELSERIKELDKEEIEIHFGEHSTKYDALFAALSEEKEDEEEKLSGIKAYGYNELLEAFEMELDGGE